MSLLLLPRSFQVNSAGSPYGGAKLYVYRAGTLTDLPVYTTASFSIAHPQPVQADASGLFPAIYIDPSLGFDVRVILKTSANVAIYDEDNIPRSSNVLGATTVTGTLSVSDRATSDGVTSTDTVVISEPHPRVYLNETDAAAGKRAWCLEVDGAVLTLSTVTDGLAAGSPILKVTRGTGTAITSIELGGSTIIESGSFTITGTTGYTGSPSGTMKYIKNGSMVTLYPNGNIVGSVPGAPTAVVWTGIPAALQPATARTSACVISNSPVTVVEAGFVTVSASLTLYKGTVSYLGSATNFATAVATGFPSDFCVTYAL